METGLYIAIIGLVGAGIGWITNILAIRLLFRPYRPCRMPLTGWVLQGLIPKRQKDIALALGKVVSTELITGDDVAVSLTKEEIREKIGAKMEGLVQERVLSILPALIPARIQLTMAEFIGKNIRQEVQVFLENPHQIFKAVEIEEIREEIQKIVENKILSFEVERMEEITYLIAARELRHIEILGGVLGFGIGIIQGVITVIVLK